MRKKFRKPRHGGDELDANADKRQTSKRDELPNRGAEARGKDREGVEHDAPDEHAPASEPIGQIAAKQSKNAAGDRGDPEQHANPLVVRGRAWRGVDKFAQRRRDDERQHQHDVRVERETDRGDCADEPLNGRQPRGRCLHVARIIGKKRLVYCALELRAESFSMTSSGMSIGCMRSASWRTHAAVIVPVATRTEPRVISHR